MRAVPETAVLVVWDGRAGDSGLKSLVGAKKSPDPQQKLRQRVSLGLEVGGQRLRSEMAWRLRS